MQLLISTTISTVSSYRLEGVVIELTFDKILFCWLNVKAGVHLKEIQVGWWIILKRIFKFEWKELKWIGLDQDGYNWRVLVFPVMNI